MKFFLALVAGLFISLAATAQIRKDPTSWSVKVDKQPAKVGDIVSIQIQVRIADSWHIYSNDLNPDIGPLPTSFKFPTSDNYALVGKTTPVGVQEVFEEVWGTKVRQFENKALFVQKIKVLKPRFTFTGTAEYMSCSSKDGTCLPPAEVDLSTEVKAIASVGTVPANSTTAVASTPAPTSTVTKPTSETTVAAATPASTLTDSNTIKAARTDGFRSGQ